MHIAMITSGGAGMFCGSCMHDNTLARALLARGHQVSLIPTYTPIRVDEKNVSQQRVFLGGINVYLDAQVPLWRFLPRVMKRWLDSPRVIRFATQWGVSSDAKQLGKLTLALLAGDMGPQQVEIADLVDFLVRVQKPDVIIYSNALLVGTLATLRRKFTGRIYCLLQGDDIFLEDLSEPYRTQSIDIIRREMRHFDGVLVHSEYYKEFMSNYLHLDAGQVHVVPLGIDLEGHDGEPRPREGTPLTIGYFARICPEKGLHNLVDAFRLFQKAWPDSRLRAAGYLGKRDEAYFQKLMRDAADLGESFQYLGSPASHAEKVAILKSFDILSVPTDYHEPKGLPVLEALANGVPVVQPRHGSFPEMVMATRGGLLVEPRHPQALADGWLELARDEVRRLNFAREGQAAVRSLYSTSAMAENTLRVLASLK